MLTSHTSNHYTSPITITEFGCRLALVINRTNNHIRQSDLEYGSYPTDQLHHFRTKLLDLIRCGQESLRTQYQAGPSVQRMMNQLSDLRSSIEALPDYTSCLKAAAEKDHLMAIVKEQNPLQHHDESLSLPLNVNTSTLPNKPEEHESTIDTSNDDEWAVNLLDDEYKSITPLPIPPIELVNAATIPSTEDAFFTALDHPINTDISVEDNTKRSRSTNVGSDEQESAYEKPSKKPKLNQQVVGSVATPAINHSESHRGNNRSPIKQADQIITKPPLSTRRNITPD